MANRPVYCASLNHRPCIRENVTFEYFGGFSLSQKRRCVNSLHQAFLKANPDSRLLEISSKSENELGIKLSAFNLMIKSRNGKMCSVESAFQAGKVFENGGPYVDLLDVSSREAKRDERLKSSGRIISFQFDGMTFETEPKTFFYNWLYISALKQNKELSALLLEYDAFTDIEFNPQKSLNCQAEAAAVFVSLVKQNLLEQATKDPDNFKRIVYCHTK